MRDQRNEDSDAEPGTWDGSKVVICFIVVLLLLVLSVILISVNRGGHDMDDMDMGLHSLETLPRCCGSMPDVTWLS